MATPDGAAVRPFLFICVYQCSSVVNAQCSVCDLCVLCGDVVRQAVRWVDYSGRR